MPLILSLLGLGVFIGATILISMVVLKLDMKTLMKESENPDDNISEAERDRYIGTYLNVFRNLNVKSLLSISTDLFYHQTLADIQHLTSVGLRKDIEFAAGENPDGTSMGFAMVLGKFAWTSHQMNGSCRERIVDSLTDRVLVDKYNPAGWLLLSLNKTPGRTKNEEIYCSGCGTPLLINGELFICKNCGATYTADSYDWVINKFKLNSSAVTNGATFAGFAVCCLPILALVSLFVKFLQPISNVLSCALIFGSIAYLIAAVIYYIALLKLSSYDRNSSMFKVEDRFLYLTSLFVKSRSGDRSAMKMFMHEGAYNYWLQNDIPTGNRIIDYEFSKLTHIKDFIIADGYQHLTIKSTVKMVLFNEQTRQVQKIKRPVSFGLYRRQNTRYESKAAAEIINCSGCGMSINMTADGKCKFCGKEFDVADYDWKIEWMDHGFYV